MQPPASAKLKIPSYFYVLQMLGLLALVAGILTLFTSHRQAIVEVAPYLANRALDWFLLVLGITLMIVFNMLLFSTLKRQQVAQQRMKDAP